MAYEYDPVTGRNMPGPENNVRSGGKSTPWLLLAAVIVAILALLFIFGGSGDEAQAPAAFGTAPSDVAPATDGAAPATGGELAPAQPEAAPAPAAPLD